MNNLRLTIDLVPKGAWKNNLRERLSQKDWDKLRKICYEKSNYRCSVCGKQNEQLEAHEVWDFDIAKKTQKLTNIIALCAACHGVKHIRNSERIGYGEQAKSHFMKINKCSTLVFAGHYAEAMQIFDERNKIFRWKLIADLQKFGGKGMELYERNIPIIISPYENVNFDSVRHVRIISNNISDSPEKSSSEKETIILQNVFNPSLCDPQKNAKYFVYRVPHNYPPKIMSIDIDNYSGKIIVKGDRANKIIWYSGNKIIKTKYFFNERFVTDFNVENLTIPELCFVLVGSGGKTIAQSFVLNGDD